MAIKYCSVAKDPQNREYNTHLVSHHYRVILLTETDQPHCANDTSNVGQNTFQLSEYCVRHEPKERAMLMNCNCSIMGLRKRLMMVRRPYVRLIVVIFGSKTQVYHQLLGSTNAKIRVDKGDVLLWHYYRLKARLSFVKSFKKDFIIINSSTPVWFCVWLEEE